jgi:hypothetical protein
MSLENTGSVVNCKIPFSSSRRSSGRLILAVVVLQDRHSSTTDTSGVAAHA